MDGLFYTAFCWELSAQIWWKSCKIIADKADKVVLDVENFAANGREFSIENAPGT